MKLPRNVELIISRLNSFGHRADVVGGPVRDHLRGVTPSDYDITTSARPDEVKRVFADERIVDTGIKHGTVTLILGGTPYEITTYRIDGEYLDARHPESVSFTERIEEDLARRDFTVNAIAYNPHDGITDPYLGRDDIEKRIIRAVGDPYLRFSEDALRILRALRFASILGFEIEENTAEALRAKAGLLSGISAERIYTEWKKLLSGDFAYEVISEFSDVIVLFLPELKGLQLPEKEHFAKELLIRETAIFQLTSKEPAADFDKAMRRLKADTKTRELGVKMLENTGKYCPMSLTDAGLMLMDLGKETAFAVAELDISLGRIKKDARAYLREYIDRELPYRLSDLRISGSDVTALGIKGRRVGEMLSELLELTVRGEAENEKNALISYIKAQIM